jgi:hypothetical protein
MKTISASLSNYNLTTLSSYRLKAVELSYTFYGGQGYNFYNMKITDHRLSKTVSGSRQSPTLLLGIYCRVGIIELAYEVGLSQIPNRTGKNTRILNPQLGGKI